MLRVAIVGLGPKGLFALERMVDRAAGLADGARIDVDVFEPHPAAGAGPNYDPAQPPYLRMNFAARAVNMWAPTSAGVPADERLSYVAWRDRRDGGDGGDGGDYPSRADVGRYLASGLASILRHAPSTVRVTFHRARVVAVTAGAGQWDVVADHTTRRYDEVLLATGHEQSWDGGLDRDWAHAAALVPAVFPVGRRLSPQRVAPDAVVAVRGLALTFIDAALALTEGRGGSFEALDHPYRLRYVPGDGDVRVILPFSRTGRAMLAKPDPAVAAGLPALAAIAERGRARILDLADGFDLRRDLLAILAEAAADALHATRDQGDRDADDRAALGRWLAAAITGVLPGGRDPAADLDRSLAVGARLRAPDRQWALGQAWRELYPALVLRLGADGLAGAQWPMFRALAAEMERLAFGPSARNVAKLLALVDAGRVDLTHVRDPDLRTRDGCTYLSSEQGERAIDVVVDAVLPAPGAVCAHGEPLRGLIEAGHLRVAPGRRGLDVDGAGACLRSDGIVSHGLSAIGRATEDVVIGNDTLSRTLHPLADRWAQRLVARCREARVLTPAGSRQAGGG